VIINRNDAAFAFCKEYETTDGLLTLLFCMNQPQILAVVFRANTTAPICKKGNSPLPHRRAQYFEEADPVDPYSKISITITAHYG